MVLVGPPYNMAHGLMTIGPLNRPSVRVSPDWDAGGGVLGGRAPVRPRRHRPNETQTSQLWPSQTVHTMDLAIRYSRGVGHLRRDQSHRRQQNREPSVCATLLALDPTPFISMLVSSSFADDAATARKSLGENGSASAKTWTGRTIGPSLLPHNCLLRDASHTRNFPAQLSLLELTVFSCGQVGSRVRLAI